MAPQAGTPSLLEIQQEQARQLEEKRRQQEQQVQAHKAKVRTTHMHPGSDAGRHPASRMVVLHNHGEKTPKAPDVETFQFVWSHIHVVVMGDPPPP